MSYPKNICWKHDGPYGYEQPCPLCEREDQEENPPEWNPDAAGPEYWLNYESEEES